jgi:hypothetical protein
MYKQTDNVLNGAITVNSKLRKRVLATLTTLFISLSLIVTLGVSAHDIDKEQARQKLEPYVRNVTGERNYRADAVGKISCGKLYPHQVECLIQYQTEQDYRANRTTCSERITVYFKSHNGSKRDWTYYTTHQGAHKCGTQYLSGPNP